MQNVSIHTFILFNILKIKKVCDIDRPNNEKTYFINIFTIYFHSSPESFEFSGLNSSQLSTVREFISLRNLLKEYSDIEPDIIPDKDDDNDRGIPNIRIANALLLSTP